MRQLYNLLKETGNRISLILILLGSHLLMAQNIDYLWAKSVGGIQEEQVYDVTLDASGNVYTVGRFRNTVDFDPGTGTSNITATSGYNAFISKLDASGNFIWAKNFGGQFSLKTNTVEIDAFGNIYISGSFQGTADFDPGAATFNLTANGVADDIFILKLDASGNFVWVKQIGGTNGDFANAIITDPSGNIYLTGVFMGTVDFDPGAGTSNLVSNGFNQDIFVTKLDASGDLIWAKGIGAGSDDLSKDISVDAAGNVYTTGFFADIVDFDPGAGTSNLSSGGGNAIFISKLDASGDFVWAKSFEGANYNGEGSSIFLDNDENIYTTGSFSNTVDFDPGTGVSNLTTNGTSDVFISKLDDTGDFLWAKSFSGLQLNYGVDVSVDGLGNVFSIGTFYGTVDFDPGSGIESITSNGSGDIYVSVLDPTGEFIWASSFGDIDLDRARGLYLDDFGNTHIVGEYEGTVDFDPSTTTSIHSSNGDSDFITLKLGCSGGTSILNVNTCGTYSFNGVNYTSDNSTALDTVINASGCTSIINLNLTITPINVAVSVNANAISVGPNYTSYQWINCADNGAIPGETNASFTASVDGNYAVIVSEGTCSDTSACVSITGVGIKDIGLANNPFQLYPNPTSDLVKIPNFDYQIKTISIFDTTGKEIQSFSPNTAVIDLSLFQKGIYFVKLEIGDEIITQKIIKK